MFESCLDQRTSRRRQIYRCRKIFNTVGVSKLKSADATNFPADLTDAAELSICVRGTLLGELRISCENATVSQPFVECISYSWTLSASLTGIACAQGNNTRSHATVVFGAVHSKHYNTLDLRTQHCGLVKASYFLIFGPTTELTIFTASPHLIVSPM